MKEATPWHAPVQHTQVKIVSAGRQDWKAKMTYDLLRAPQFFASRVTKWSTDCDAKLHRLVCHIHSTLDLKVQSFVDDGF